MDVIFVIIICLLSAALSIWLGEEIDARAQNRRFEKRKPEGLCECVNLLEKNGIVDESAANELKNIIKEKFG